MTDTTDDFDKRFDEMLKPKTLAPADADQLVLDIWADLPFVETSDSVFTYVPRATAPQVFFEIEPEEAVEIEQAARRAGHADLIVADDLDDDQGSDDDRAAAQALFLDPSIYVSAHAKQSARLQVEEAAPKITIQVYLTNGVVREYEVPDHTTAREHVAEIIATGYRSVDAEAPHILIHWPPHKIVKVKAVAAAGAPFKTGYFDRARGT